MSTKRYRLADVIAHAMPLNDYGDRIMWGDGLLNNVAYGRVRGRMSNHPLDRMIMALDALDRAPDLFEKGYAMIWTGTRETKVRSFRLIGTPRPIPGELMEELRKEAERR